MELQVLEKLDELIKEGEELLKQIHNLPAPSGRIRTFSEYYVDDRQRMQTWCSTSEAFIKRYSPNDVVQFKFSSSSIKTDHNRLLAILKSIKNLAILPIPQKEKEGISPLIAINNTQSQTQSQSQELINSIFIESIKDELTGKQQKEIKTILDENNGQPEIAKTKLIDKLKSFGSDVASNILANIITNPSIWNGF